MMMFITISVRDQSSKEWGDGDHGRFSEEAERHESGATRETRSTSLCINDDDVVVYYYIDERLKLEVKTENNGV